MGGLQTFNLKFYFKSIFIKQLQTYIFPQEKENQQYQYYVGKKHQMSNEGYSRNASCALNLISTF